MAQTAAFLSDVASTFPQALDEDWHTLREQIRAWRPDLIVTVARKMPRIDQALDLRFSDIATTVTDLALPFSAPFVSGARVAVVDDIVNVGTTLHRAYQVLESQGASSVQMFAVYASGLPDRFGRSISLASPGALSREECSTVAQQVPGIIARLNKPYDLDFPVIRCRLSSPLATGRDLYSACVDKFGARVFDLSTSAGLDAGRTRLTVDWPSSSGAYGKIRIYFDELTHECSFVPMWLSSPISEDAWAESTPAWVTQIRKTLEGAVSQGTPEPLVGEARARVRIYLDSIQFGLAALSEMAGILSAESKGLLSTTDAELVFGPVARRLHIPPSPSLDTAFLERAPSPLQPSPAASRIWNGEFADEVRKRRASEDPASSVVALFDVLSRWAGSEDVNEYRLDWPYSAQQIKEDPYRRLRIGFTFADLTCIVKDLSPTVRTASHWRATVSRLLDQLIDSGAIVPTVANYEGEFHRVYRKGEARARIMAVHKVLTGLTEYGEPISRTRISKVGAILSFVYSRESGTHVSGDTRGTVVSLDSDLLDGDAEITSFLLRTGKLKEVQATKRSRSD